MSQYITKFAVYRNAIDCIFIDNHENIQTLPHNGISCGQYGNARLARGIQEQQELRKHRDSEC